MVSVRLVVVLACFFLVFLVAGCLGPPAPSPAPLPTQVPGQSFSERCASPASDSALNVEPPPIVDECERQKALQPESCTALNGDTGITGSLAKPKILNEWSWEIPSDALDASNPNGVYGDAYQFFVVLFQKLKFAQTVAEEQQATQPIETLLSFELLLKPDYYTNALKAFDESRNTQFFNAPSWFTEGWFVLSQIPESGSPVLQFNPVGPTSPGRYRVRILPSNLNPAVSGQEAFFVVTHNGQPLPRYNTLTISFEKTAEPEPDNPLYWISLDAGLEQGSGFGVQFSTENNAENQSLLWTDSLDVSTGFSLGKKNVLLLSGNSFEAINNPEMSGMVLRMHPQAEWMIFSPNSPVSIAARLNSEDHTNWAYRFIHNDSSWFPENASSTLIWNALTSTSPTCEDVPRNVQDQWENQSDCENGPGFSAQLSPVGTPSTTGIILSTTTVFVPANQEWSMQSCTVGVPFATTTQIQNNNAFDLENNPNSGTQLRVRSVQDVMNGVENESICVVTKNKDGIPLDETRFAWSAKALQNEQVLAAGRLGISDFTACPFYSEPAPVECPVPETNPPEPPEKAIQPDLYNAGLQIMEIPYAANGQTKMIPMAVWYPTIAPTASHLYSSLQPESEVAVDAPIAEGKFPLVLFAHGNMTTAIQSVFLTEYLAQRGYVVAATDYDDALFDSRTGDQIWPGGAPFFAVWFPDQWSDGSPALYRRDESHLVLEQLCSLNADSGNQFFGHLDFSRLGAVGWSLGGYTVAGLIGGYASWHEPDIKAAVLQAPFLTPYQFNSGDLSRISVPVMVQGGTADFFTTGSPSLQELAENINPPKYFLAFKDFDHFSWTDVPCQKFSSVPECRNDPKTQAILLYTTAFLDYYLKNDSKAKPKLDAPNPLLTVFEHQD